MKEKKRVKASKVVLHATEILFKARLTFFASVALDILSDENLSGLKRSAAGVEAGFSLLYLGGLITLAYASFKSWREYKKGEEPDYGDYFLSEGHIQNGSKKIIKRYNFIDNSGKEILSNGITKEQVLLFRLYSDDKITTIRQLVEKLDQYNKSRISRNVLCLRKTETDRLTMTTAFTYRKYFDIFSIRRLFFNIVPRGTYNYNFYLDPGNLFFSRSVFIIALMATLIFSILSAHTYLNGESSLSDGFLYSILASITIYPSLIMREIFSRNLYQSEQSISLFNIVQDRIGEMIADINRIHNTYPHEIIATQKFIIAKAILASKIRWLNTTTHKLFKTQWNFLKVNVGISIVSVLTNNYRKYAITVLGTLFLLNLASSNNIKSPAIAKGIERLGIFEIFLFWVVFIPTLMVSILFKYFFDKCMDKEKDQNKVLDQKFMKQVGLCETGKNPSSEEVDRVIDEMTELDRGLVKEDIEPRFSEDDNIYKFRRYYSVISPNVTSAFSWLFGAISGFFLRVSQGNVGSPEYAVGLAFFALSFASGFASTNIEFSKDEYYKQAGDAIESDETHKETVNEHLKGRLLRHGEVNGFDNECVNKISALLFNPRRITPSPGYSYYSYTDYSYYSYTDCSQSSDHCDDDDGIGVGVSKDDNACPNRRL